MHIALVTPYFLVSSPYAGGLPNYLGRMARLLKDSGHEVDIFVPIEAAKAHLPAEMDWHGCRLHHVLRRKSLGHSITARLLQASGRAHLSKKLFWMARAKTLAAAVDRIHDRHPFDVVHSAESYGVGLGITKKPSRLRMVRCSAATELFKESGGNRSLLDQAQIELEEASIRQSDFAFAPSHLVAKHYGRRLGRDIGVVPTPIYIETAETGRVPSGMPPRYLLHFAGELGLRKGSDLVAAALSHALVEAPDMQMIWVGDIRASQEPQVLSFLSAGAKARLIHLPQQDKPTLYALICGAVCTVLPSRVDNLPNTVLESLMLGTPVIGTRDSSIEELVEDGVSGLLVENGSAPDLADAMVRAWTGRMGLASGPPWAESAIGRRFQPEAALTAYLDAITVARARSHAPA